MFGIGFGFIVIDNMGQFGFFFGYVFVNVKIFVFFVSIWNVIGCWVGGFMSDIFFCYYGFFCVFFFVFMMIFMVMVFFFIVMVIFGCLYFGFIFLGFFFGVQYFLYVIIVVDIFGLKFYVILYSSISFVSFVGMYVLFVFVVGKFYDVEVCYKNGVNLNLECFGLFCFCCFLLVFVGVIFGVVFCFGVFWFRI